MARIVEHLRVAELEARYRAARDATEARHTQAIWLLAQGRTSLEGAEVLAYVPRRVEEAAARYNALGPAALGGQRRRNGRAASLPTEAVLTALAVRVREPPDDGGLARRWRAMEWPEGRRLDGAASRPDAGASAAWLGGAEAHRLVGPGAAAAAPAGGDARTAGRLQGGLDAAATEAKAAHPDRPVEVWAEDEHRLGLKPIRRRVRAPIGQRPIALGHHRYQWLRVAAFVRPTSGGAVWYLCSRLSKPFFAELLATFARETGAGRDRSIILVLDDAGWHGPEGLAVPDGISLVFLPSYSPELQPAEHLWPLLVDEPIVNRHVASLDELNAIIADRCRQLDAATLKPHTDFHWWPHTSGPGD